MGDQIFVPNSTDEIVLENKAYNYEIVDQGLYFSKLDDYSIYPFQREE